MCSPHTLEEFNEESTGTSIENVKKIVPGIMSQSPLAGPATPKVTTKKRAGRRKLWITLLLSCFQSKRGKSLKLEYLRLQNIRGIRKLIKWILVKHCLPSQKGIFKFDRQDPTMQRKLQELVTFVQENAQLFVSFGFSEKEKRKSLSFNISYSKEFYRSEEVRHVHFLYLQVIYGLHSVDPESLCKKLGVSCCGGEHDNHCVKIWTRLKKYVMVGMIQDLEYEAYIIEEEFQRTDFSVEEDTQSTSLQVEEKDTDFPNPDFYLA